MRNKLFNHHCAHGRHGNRQENAEFGVLPDHLQAIIIDRMMIGGAFNFGPDRRGRHAAGPGHRGGPGGGRGFGFGGPFDGPGSGGGGRHGGGRRKRLFDQSELQALLLALIAQTPRHGYDLIREIESLSGGEYAPSPGVVYPALTYMEEFGLIAQVDGDTSRKAFAATEAGLAQVADDGEKVEALKARLTGLADNRDKLDPAPVRRAMHNLRTAVIDRLSRDEASRDLVLKIAEMIDEVTHRVERIEP